MRARRAPNRCAPNRCGPDRCGPWLALALGLAAGACGTEAPGGPGTAQGPHVALETDAREVELGLGFPLTVVRSYGRDFEAEPFDPASLAPLEVRPLGSARRTRAGRVSEAHRFTAHAFELERLTVPAPILRVRPRGGGAARSIEGEPLELRVRSALPAGAPGAAELPGGPLGEPSPWPHRLALGGALALLLAALFLRPGRALSRAAHPDPPPAELAARSRALARLAAWSSRARTDAAADDAALHVELAATLREYLEEAHGLPAPRRSSEELFADPRTAEHLGPARHRDLARILAACDGVKFARHSTPAAERAEHLAAAVAWLGAGSRPGAAEIHSTEVAREGRAGRGAGP